MDARNNVRDLFLVGQMRYDLRLCKDRACRADLDPRIRLSIKRAQLISCGLEHARHYIKKSTCACSAFLIHDEVVQATALIQSERFHILTANVNNGACFRNHEVHTARMTAEFADLLVCFVKVQSSIACCNRIVDFIPSKVAIFEKLLKRLIGSRGACAKADNRACVDILTIFKHYRFCRCRANVDPEGIHKIHLTYVSKRAEPLRRSLPIRVSGLRHNRVRAKSLRYPRLYHD